MLVGERVASALIEKGGEFYHGFTYSGHPVACAVALANLEVIERDRLVERANPTGDLLRAKLRDSVGDHPLVGEIRGIGMIGAIELTSDKSRRANFAEDAHVGLRCRNHCFRNDFIMRAVRDSMIFAPALTFSEADIDEFVARATLAIDQTYAELRRDGLV
jgi:putrescine aminotransferase